MAEKVLVIAENPDAGMRVHDALESAGFHSQWCRELPEAVAGAASWRPGAVLIGPRTMASMRASHGDDASRFRGPTTRVVVAGEAMEVTAGSGDRAPEAVARLRTIGQAAAGTDSTSESRATPRDDDAPDAFRSGSLRVDLAGHRVWMGEQEVHLAPLEFRLLAFFIAHRGQLLRREQILAAVWGPEYLDDWSLLREAVKTLRHKIGDPEAVEGGAPSRIVTVRGEGYRFN